MAGKWWLMLVKCSDLEKRVGQWWLNGMYSKDFMGCYRDSMESVYICYGFRTFSTKKDIDCKVIDRCVSFGNHSQRSIPVENIKLNDTSNHPLPLSHPFY